MRRTVDLTRGISLALSLLCAMALCGMLLLLVVDSLPVWRHEGVGYLLGSSWFYRAQSFEVAPMIYGSLMVSGLALALATPVALGAAIFTAEFLAPRYRLLLKLPIEMLAGVPSVVYGLLGLLLLRNWVMRL